MKKSFLLFTLCGFGGIIFLSACLKNSDAQPLEIFKVSTLFVSNAETTVNAKNLQLFKPADSTVLVPKFELNNGAQDANGVLFVASKNFLFQVSRAQKSIRLYTNASTLFEASLPNNIIIDSTLSSGREIAYDETNDALFVANNTDSTIRVYEKVSTLNGKYVGKKLKLSGEPWGITYDKKNNRLFVVMDKNALRIEIYNNPSGIAAGKVTASLRFFINGYKINGATARLHGIAYSSQRDMLFVTEIGNASGTNFDKDGGIYIIDKVSKITNNSSILANRAIYGSNTGLGNPVDIAIDDRNIKGFIYVAEKANKKILVFGFGDNGNVAPIRGYTSTFSPEAIDIDY